LVWGRGDLLNWPKRGRVWGWVAAALATPPNHPVPPRPAPEFLFSMQRAMLAWRRCCPQGQAPDLVNRTSCTPCRWGACACAAFLEVVG
jgi:hypothetical protein